MAALAGLDGRIEAHHFNASDCIDLSSNRSAFSEPWYVLYPRADFGDWAVFRFSRQDIPSEVKRSDPKADPYQVRTEPDPCECNFGHCETRVFRGTTRMRRNQVKQDGRNILRLSFSRALTLCREPGLQFPPEGWIEPPIE